MTSLNSNQLRKNYPKDKSNLEKQILSLPKFLDITVGGIQVIVSEEKLCNVKSLGEGSFSIVHLMKHSEKEVNFAVKICDNLTDDQKKAIKTDIDIGNMVSSQFKIHYYGAIQNSNSIWILMEPMEICVKDFYMEQLKKNDSYRLPNYIIGYFAYCSVYGLDDLYTKQIMHRDIKPSNMLLSKDGSFKLCDFGISGKMKDSLAQSAVGTNAYLAPERINPLSSNEPYTIKADIWSLGLSIMEIAIMKFPYGNSMSLMAQLTAIVNGPPPSFPKSSPYINDFEMIEFFDCTLAKDFQNRKKYEELKKLKFINKFKNKIVFNDSKKQLSIIIEHLDNNNK